MDCGAGDDNLRQIAGRKCCNRRQSHYDMHTHAWNYTCLHVQNCLEIAIREEEKSIGTQRLHAQDKFNVLQACSKAMGCVTYYLTLPALLMHIKLSTDFRAENVLKELCSIQ